MTHLPRSPLCPGCAEAQALMNRLSEAHAQDTTPHAVLQAQLPLLLETALSLLLSEFDREAHPYANTTLAIELIALGAEHAQGMQER